MFLLWHYLFVCAVYTVTMDLNDLRVPMLKAQLLARDRDARGTKAVLVGRLRDVLLMEGVDVEQFVSELLGASPSGPCQTKDFTSAQSAAPVPSIADDLEVGGSRADASKVRHSPAASLGRSSFVVDSVPGGLPADPIVTGEAAAVCPGAGVSQDERDVQQTEATDHDDEVQADDSASQVGLGGSSVSGHSSGSAQSLESLRVRESAKQAALRVRMKFLKDKQMLEVREQELRMRKQELELQAALVESEAREAALTPSRSNSVVTGTVGRMLEFRSSLRETKSLNSSSHLYYNKYTNAERSRTMLMRQNEQGNQRNNNTRSPFK